jgi:hypothetical protein
VYVYLDTIRKFTAMLIMQQVAANTVSRSGEEYMDLSYSKCLNKQAACLWDGNLQNAITLCSIIIIGIQPLDRSGQRPELSQATGMALVRCILGKFLGVHLFKKMMVAKLVKQVPLHFSINYTPTPRKKKNIMVLSTGHYWTQS